jgi:serine/threonine-protein kinase SRPK3
MSLFARSWQALLRRPWKPLTFPNKGFAVIPADTRIEEETVPDYVATRYYPARIGEILSSRYQVVGKLGFGTTSTVWLARDLRWVGCILPLIWLLNGCSSYQHVALKLFNESKSIASEQDNELDVYNSLRNSPADHPGRTAIRSLLDSFYIDGPNGKHQCMVHSPLWGSMYQLRHLSPDGKLPEVLVAIMLKRIFQALDLLHNECHVAHTDISESNILLKANEDVLTTFEEAELKEPSPRKEIEGRTIYMSRELSIPESWDAPILSDFGSTTRLDDGAEHRDDIQPNVYRSPEVIMDIPWSYSVDIWNVGCMVWDTLDGRHLFTGYDPEVKAYRGRAHLAEIIALLGPPPSDLLARANLRSKFFSDSGKLSVAQGNTFLTIQRRILCGYTHCRISITRAQGGIPRH